MLTFFSGSTYLGIEADRTSSISNYKLFLVSKSCLTFTEFIEKYINIYNIK
jgi:hypothetical protein